MASRYWAAVRTVATAATADNVASALWNPHGTKAIYCRELHVFTTTAGAMNIGIQRISTNGTPVVTVTPDVDNAADRLAVPASGALVYGDFSAEPTQQGPYMIRAITAAVIGAGVMYTFPEPIKIPAGTGLALNTTQAIAFPVSDVTWVWDE
jgi:hypothetical protein